VSNAISVVDDGIMQIMTNEEYVNTILKWRQEVDTNLRSSENSWLALAGLFWLRKGENIIGSDIHRSDCDILLLRTRAETTRHI
jgi:hypothetical protein